MVLFYNLPSKSKELQILESLHQRTALPHKNLKRLSNLHKGYEGELLFHEMLQENLKSDCIVIYDLLLKINESVFQVDCTIIQQHHIWHLEVKNYAGVFQLRDKAIYNLHNNQEVLNPLNQLERARFLFNQTLQKLDCRIPVKSYVVFVHPEFTLYQYDPQLPIVHQTDILRFIRVLSNTPSKLSSYDHTSVHNLFKSQIAENPYERLPKYEMKNSKKGIRCLKCSGFLLADEIKLDCSKCGYTEGFDAGIMRSVIEYHSLFPEKKMTTKIIWEWCNINRSKEFIRKVLNKYMISNGERRHRHFTFPNFDRKKD